MSKKAYISVYDNLSEKQKEIYIKADADSRNLYKQREGMTPEKLKMLDAALESAKKSRKIARERISSGNFSEMPKEIEELFS